MGLLRRILCACGLAAGRVAQGARSSVSTEVPERVANLLREIDEADFGGIDFNETGISSCWIRLPRYRTISARWYSTGARSELWMQSRDVDKTELPNDKWSEMILRAIIHKTRTHHDAKLASLL